jgi:hypothetical protein
MKRNLITVSLVAALAIALGANGVVKAASTVDEQVGRVLPPTQDPGWIGAYVDDATTMIFPSIMYAGTRAEVSSGKGRLCPTLDTGACKDKSLIGTFNLYLPRCENDQATDCVESVKAIKPDGTSVEGKFKSYFPNETAPYFTGDPTRGIPNGWSPSLWNFPGITHQGGSDFLLAAQELAFQIQVSNPAERNQLEVALYPVSQVPSDRTYSNAQDNPDGSLGWQINSDKCPIFLGDHVCATPWPFPQGVRFQTTIRTSVALQGWIHGRLNQPDITYTPFGATNVYGTQGTKIEITAGTETVPVFASWLKYQSLPADFKAFVDSKNTPTKGIVYAPYGSNNWRNIWDGSGVAPYSKLSFQFDLDNYDNTDFTQFEYFLKQSNDTALANKSQWAFYTGLTGDRTQNNAFSRCINQGGRISGVVSTNSTMYLDAPPTYDEATKSLNYRVSSPHFDAHGVPNVGHYDLLVSSEAARCLYNLTSAPVKASVQVISSDGTTQVATSILNEINGYIHLSVSGFGYSSPTLSIKFSQDAPTPVATPSPTVTPSPTPVASESPTPAPVATKAPAVAKKITITCVKGKNTKTVTAVKPTCPAGYKRK